MYYDGDKYTNTVQYSNHSPHLLLLSSHPCPRPLSHRPAPVVLTTTKKSELSLPPFSSPTASSQIPTNSCVHPFKESFVSTFNGLILRLTLSQNQRPDCTYITSHPPSKPSLFRPIILAILHGHCSYKIFELSTPNHWDLWMSGRLSS